MSPWPGIIAWGGIAFGVGGIVGWIGGYAYGWLMGTEDTERRWSQALDRADEQRRIERVTAQEAR